MKQPCEYDSHKVLPTIRIGLTRFLMNKAGMNQTEVSELLGISQAAVSHYSSSKRGDESLLEVYPEIERAIVQLGEEMAKGLEPKVRQERICAICREFRNKLMEESLK